MEYRFDDILEIKNGKNQKAVENPEGCYPIYGSGGVIGYANDYICEADTVIIGRKGSINNPIYVSQPFWNVDTAFGLSVKTDLVLPRYLYYFCKKFDFEKLNKTVTIPSLTKSDLLKVKITVPGKKEQQAIIDKLMKIESIIAHRKEELDYLDLLIKARFVEMFGTLKNPTKTFEKATLKELCTKITDGKHGGCKSKEGTKRYFVGAREIYDDKVHYDSAPEINIEEFEKDYKRCNVEIGDFLIVNTGATIGKSAIASDMRTEHTLLQKSVALLKVKKEVLNSVFLKWCYRINTQMYMVESASAQPNLLLSKINTTVIYVPDIELQNRFADFEEQVNKSKVILPKSSSNVII